MTQIKKIHKIFVSSGFCFESVSPSCMTWVLDVTQIIRIQKRLLIFSFSFF